MQDPASKTTEGMTDYDRNSAVQGRLVQSFAKPLRRAVLATGVVEPDFRIVDYGCGPGHTALESVRPAIEAYRSLTASGAITVCHADQSGNDWNGLFSLIFGPDGYRGDDPAIRTEASVGSFFEIMAEPGSVALATCFTANHWFSRAPHCLSPGASWFGALKGEALEQVSSLAEADWTAFLRSRAAELRPGGHLVVGALGAVAASDPTEPDLITARGVHMAIERAAQSLVDDGLLAQEALDRFVCPWWFRTAEETRRPLEREADLAERFEIVDLQTRPAPINHEDVYAEHRGDPERYGQLYVGYIRGFGDSTLRKHLFEASSDDPAEVEHLSTAFYARIAHLYSQEPDKYKSATWHLTLVLRRRA